MEKTIIKEKQPAIDGNKITIEVLRDLRAEMVIKFKPAVEEYEKASAKYNEHRAKFDKEYLVILNYYFDQILTDKNGDTVKVGDTISRGKRQYRVVDRSLQIVFGEILNNPRVWIVKISKEGTINPNARKMDICKMFLIDFEIVKS
ncbi:MAG TPA: hypothetical protein VFC36_09710 [Paludibacter sp.]|nr:hypothetical protein [Paludibacter sp.]